MLLAVEDRTHAHVSRSLLCRDAVVLARPHRQHGQAELLGEIAQPPEVRPATTRDRPSPAASSSGPERQGRPRADEVPLRRHAPLRGLTERFTSTRPGTVNRRAADSDSSECTSSQIRLTTFTLFDCSRPMKCQRNASPYSACLRSRSCARFRRRPRCRLQQEPAYRRRSRTSSPRRWSRPPPPRFGCARRQHALDQVT